MLETTRPCDTLACSHASVPPAAPTATHTHSCVLRQLLLQGRHLLLPRVQQRPHTQAITHDADEPQQGRQALLQAQAVVASVLECSDPGLCIRCVLGGGCNQRLLILTVWSVGV
jgi:hypothetical protein